MNDHDKFIACLFLYISEFSLSLEEDIMDRTQTPVQSLLLALQKVRNMYHFEAMKSEILFSKGIINPCPAEPR